MMCAARELLQKSTRALLGTIIALCVVSPATAMPSLELQRSADSPTFLVKAESKLCDAGPEEKTSAAQLLVELQITSGPNAAGQKPFETFWYSQGKPRGLKREGRLNIPAGQRVVISLEQSSSSVDESQASASAILHLVLSILLNHDKVTAVVLPDAGYSMIASAMQSHNGRILPPGELAPEAAQVQFELQSTSGRSKQTIYFM